MLHSVYSELIIN